jgi:hypothetical protein
MKNLFTFLLFTGLTIAQFEPVESKVVEATVFKDRAMVTRSADVNLKKGENQIMFSDLTTDINDQSVRISAKGNGEIKILDVKVERRFTAEIRKEKISELQKKIDALKNEMLIANDQIAIYDSQKEFIESLKAESVKYANQKILMGTNSPKEWNELLKFIDTNLKEIYSGIREEAAKRSVLDEEVKALQLTINQSEGGEQKNYKEIMVKIDALQNGNAEIQASYIVSSASWYPLYDARVESKTKLAEFSFYGMIQQSTGEDWNDVKLTFSTADPLSIKSLPKLETWFLNVNPLPYGKLNVRGGKLEDIQIQAGGYETQFGSYDQNWGLPNGMGAMTGYITDAETGEPLIGANVLLTGTSYGSATDVNGRYYLTNVPASKYNVKVTYVGYNSCMFNLNVREKNVANVNIPLQAGDLSLSEVVVTGNKVFEQKSTNTVKIISGISGDENQLPVYSDVKAKDLSTTFELNTKNTIPSDNSQHKVTIAINNLPIEFSYTSIPKIIEKVYVKGKASNNNDYPLLAGEINIFVDNDFVNRSYISTIVPTDTLELALGIDESIKCEKILKNRFVESKGLFGGSKQITYEYEIKITNNRKTEESINVFDQLPVAMNEKIKVEPITPTEEEMKPGQNRELVWNLKLVPGEIKTIPLKFTVEFPNDVTVYGLE